MVKASETVDGAVPSSGQENKGAMPEIRHAYTIPDFSHRLSISQSFAWKMLADGRLNAIRIGRRTLIPHSELERLSSAA